MNFNGYELPQIGQSLQGYRIEAQLGQGGMGAVFRATKNGAEYAMKVLPNAYQSDHARFEREAVSLAAVRHPNIVTIHTFHRDGPWTFIIFEFVRGCDLSHRIGPEQIWSIEDSLTFLRPLAQALDHIHAQGLVHRDIKPANILIRERDGAPMLTDFGIVKDKNFSTLTQSGEVVGTIHYMAPEQFEGHQLSGQTDLWALAQVFYQMITGGHLPFQGDTAIQLASNVMTKAPISARTYNPALPLVIDDLTELMFEKNPQHRHESAQAFIEDCERLLLTEATSSSSIPVWSSVQRRLRRRFGAAQSRFIGVTLLLCLFSVLGLTLHFAMTYTERESWKKASTEEMIALQASVKDQLELLPSKFPKHLLNAQNQDCCGAVKELRERYSKLESSIKERRDLSGPSQEQQAFEDQLRKVQGRLKYVEWIHGLIDRDGAQLTSIPKRDKPLAEALALFRKGSYQQAQLAFENLSGSSKSWLAPVQLAAAYSAQRCGDYQAALKKLAVLDAELRFAQSIQSLRRVLHMDRCSAKLIDLRCSQRELAGYLQELIDVSENQDATFLSWNRRVNETLRKWSSRASKPIEAVFLRHRALSYQFPSLPSLQLNDDCLKRCFRSALTRKDTPKALMYFVTLRRRGVVLPIPDKFKLAFAPNGQFKASQLSKELALSQFLKSRSVDRLFEYTLEAARHGVYLDALDNIEGRALIQNNKLYEKALRLNPFDPIASFWESYSLQNIFSKEELTKNIERLGEVAGHSKLPTFYRAMAYEEQAGKLYRRDFNSLKAKRQRSLEEALKYLSKAKTLPHPRPDKVTWKRYELLRWSADHQEALTDKFADLFKILDDFKREIDDRLLRSRRDDLQRDRPFGVPFAKDSEELLKSRVASFFDQRGKLYFQVGRFQDAERALIQSIGTIYSPDSFLKLLQCIEKSKNKAGLLKLERYLGIAIADPNQAQTRTQRLKEIQLKVKEVRRLCGLD